MPPTPKAPQCCPDATGGEMVRLDDGAWLCVWCGRETEPTPLPDVRGMPTRPALPQSVAVSDSGRIVPVLPSVIPSPPPNRMRWE